MTKTEKLDKKRRKKAEKAELKAFAREKKRTAAKRRKSERTEMLDGIRLIQAEEKAARRAEKAELKERARKEKEQKKTARLAQETNESALSRLERRKAKEERRAELRKQRMTLPADELAVELQKLSREQKPSTEWVKLDNAALIFPATENDEVSSVFRLSVIVKEEVSPIALQKALNLVVPRFPTIVSAMKRGFFWYYLESSTRPLTVVEDKDYPCRKIPIDSRHPAVRILYTAHEIAVEFYHTATDGTGGITFLNTLLACYFEEKDGLIVAPDQNVLNVQDRPRPEEITDSFQSMADGVTKKKQSDFPAWKIKGTHLPAGMLHYIKGICPADKLNAAAKANGVTISQLLTTCFIWAFQSYRKFYGFSGKKPVILSVPVNLRPRYGSKTLRNFVSMLLIRGDDTLDFAGLLAFIKQQFEEQNTEEQIQGRVNINVSAQKNAFFRFVPLPVKYLLLRAVNIFAGNSKRTASLSNLGRVEAPKEFADKILRYDFGFGPQKHDVVSLYTVTYRNTAVLTFSATLKQTYVQKCFFAKLAELGVPVVVESNLDI